MMNFRTIVRHKKGEKLSDWIARAKRSGIEKLEGFAKSIQIDYLAVEAGIYLEYSNGQVEGQVNRLKNIKRQMYGRANFDLLKIRVLNSSRNHQKWTRSSLAIISMKGLTPKESLVCLEHTGIYTHLFLRHII